ncbi:MAG TPA: hypothetical protein VK712_03985, partial [Verrucomicrobiae bacterium]|nr:hypothetical protein [Verrucomicrobiae bacterium]
QKAGAAPLGDAEEVAFLKARATYEANQQEAHHKHRRLADTGLAAVIAVLIALVIVLYLMRSR